MNLLISLFFCLMLSPVASAVEGATAPPLLILAKTYDATTSDIQLHN